MLNKPNLEDKTIPDQVEPTAANHIGHMTPVQFNRFMSSSLMSVVLLAVTADVNSSVGYLCGFVVLV